MTYHSTIECSQALTIAAWCGDAPSCINVIWCYSSLSILLTVYQLIPVSFSSLLDERWGECSSFFLILLMFSGVLAVLALLEQTLLPTEPFSSIFLAMSKAVFLSGAFFVLQKTLKACCVLTILLPFSIYNFSSFSFTSFSSTMAYSKE